MMATDGASGETVARRPNNACTKCRERKVKCSGSKPCTCCVRRSETCVFDHDEKQITIPERKLRELKRKAAEHDTLRAQAKRARATSDVSEEGIPPIERVVTRGSGCNFTNLEHLDHPSALSYNTVLSNPLASKESSYITDASGRRRFLGPSSTWAYTQRLTSLIRDHISVYEAPVVPINIDGDAYQINWTSEASARAPKITDLPSLDYAIYLVNTVKFHVGQVYHLFDETSFMEHIHRHYERPSDAPRLVGDKLWYAQFLVILAFGKAFLVQAAPQHSSIPGADFFKEAVELLPAVHQLYEDSLLAMELLTSIALYFQSIDHRNAAYTYLGIALRIAMSQGLHRENAGNGLSEQEEERRQLIWWTLYVLDRKFSCLMGAPNSIRDDDVTVEVLNMRTASVNDNGLNIHVKLARLLAKLLNTVYGKDGRLDASFLKGIQEILRSMAELAPELEESFGLRLDNAGSISRMSATLNLCYHQCIVLAVRPLLMVLLQEKLERLHNSTEDQAIIDPVKALLKTCSDSSIKSIRILSALYDQHLLEMFLPFDLENLFSSTFVLSSLAAIYESSPASFEGIERSRSLLSAMIQRGSIIAGYRSAELERLHELLRTVHLEADLRRSGTNLAQQGTILTLGVSEPGGGGHAIFEMNNHPVSDDAGANNVDTNGDIHAEDSAMPPPATWVPDVSYAGNVSLSPNEIVSVAQLLEWDEMFPDTYYDPMVNDAFWA